MAVTKDQLVMAAKKAISAVVRHPAKGAPPASNGDVPLPETVLPQTPYGFPILPRSGPYGR